MLAGMNAVEWLEWQAYMDLSAMPFEEERADRRTAMIVQAIWNVQIAKNAKRNSQPHYIELFKILLGMRVGDTPDPTPKPAETASVGRTRFQALKDRIAAWGGKPVKKKT